MSELTLVGGASYDLFYTEPDNPKAMPVLIHTSRPCGSCGFPLEGIVVDQRGKPGVKVHLKCRKVGGRG